MYATSEHRVWTAKDERELKSEHKRVTRATMKHLGKLPTEQDRTFMDKLLRRQTPDADLPLSRRPLPPKPQADSHWWSRSSGKSESPRTPTHEPRTSTNEHRAPSHIEPRHEPRRAVTVTGSTRPLPPQRPEPVQTLPPRPRLKSEQGSVARRRARETALRHLEVDRGFGRYVRENRGYVAPPLTPGTWLPGQLNVVPHAVDAQPDDYPYDVVDEYGVLHTPELIDRFPIPPTQPLNITPRRRNYDTQNIPVPPVPPMPDRSNRESFLELRKKRSYRV
ncbi:hypothetical protein FRC07_009472 [Ceratobasidium sp. 392]|nr:hypothetical protein FRC07_009472 [Ceratobasidium sp. 392]